MPTLQGLLGYLTEGGAPVRNTLKGLLSGDLTPLQNAAAQLSALANPTQAQKQKLAGILAGDGQSSMGYDEAMSNPGVQAALNFAPMGIGMIKTPVGRIPENGTDTTKLAKMLKNAGERKGYRVDYDASSISPSKYVTYSKIDPLTGEIFNEKQIRLSNHADKYPELANGDRISVDPSTGISFENAVNWLGREGYPTSLSTRYRYNPTYEDIMNREIEYQKRMLDETKKYQLDFSRSYEPTYKDFYISSTKLNSGGRRYDLVNRSNNRTRFYSTDIPDEIKTNPDRSVLYEYLLNKAGWNK